MSRLLAICLYTAPLLVPLGARAEEINCVGTLSGSFDNVNVPSGRSCRLVNSYVKGSVYVRGNASVTVDRTTIIGNVQAEGARSVRLNGAGTSVNGSVQIKYGKAASTISPGTQIGGSVQYIESSGFLSLIGATIAQDVQVFENEGGASIYSNTINGNLQCKENEPAPNGGNNRVGGNKEDQCAGF